MEYINLIFNAIMIQIRHEYTDNSFERVFGNTRLIEEQDVPGTSRN